MRAILIAVQPNGTTSEHEIEVTASVPITIPEGTWLTVHVPSILRNGDTLTFAGGKIEVTVG